MTSRREAVSLQREDRHEAIRRNVRGNVRGKSFGIHSNTQATLQSILLDHLLDADSQGDRKFSMGSTDVGRFSQEDARAYLSFFTRCVYGTWHVSLVPHKGGFNFEFIHV